MSSSPTPLLSKCPTGPIAERWEKHRFELKLVNPANRRKFHVLARYALDFGTRPK